MAVTRRRCKYGKLKRKTKGRVCKKRSRRSRRRSRRSKRRSRRRSKKRSTKRRRRRRIRNCKKTTSSYKAFLSCKRRNCSISRGKIRGCKKSRRRRKSSRRRRKHRAGHSKLKVKASYNMGGRKYGMGNLPLGPKPNRKLSMGRKRKEGYKNCGA